MALVGFEMAECADASERPFRTSSLPATPRASSRRLSVPQLVQVYNSFGRSSGQALMEKPFRRRSNSMRELCQVFERVPSKRRLSLEATPPEKNTKPRRHSVGVGRPRSDSFSSPSSSSTFLSSAGVAAASESIESGASGEKDTSTTSSSESISDSLPDFLSAHSAEGSNKSDIATSAEGSEISDEIGPKLDKIAKDDVSSSSHGDSEISIESTGDANEPKMDSSFLLSEADYPGYLPQNHGDGQTSRLPWNSSFLDESNFLLSDHESLPSVGCRLAHSSTTQQVPLGETIQDIIENVARVFSVAAADILYLTVNGSDPSSILHSVSSIQPLDSLTAHCHGDRTTIGMLKKHKDNKLGMHFVGTPQNKVVISRLEVDCPSRPRFIVAGQVVEQFNGASLKGLHHSDVARLFRIQPDGRPFSITVVTPLSSASSSRPPSSSDTVSSMSIDTITEDKISDDDTTC